MNPEKQSQVSEQINHLHENVQISLDLTKQISNRLAAAMRHENEVPEKEPGVVDELVPLANSISIATKVVSGDIELKREILRLLEL